MGGGTKGYKYPLEQNKHLTCQENRWEGETRDLSTHENRTNILYVRRTYGRGETKDLSTLENITSILYVRRTDGRGLGGTKDS